MSDRVTGRNFQLRYLLNLNFLERKSCYVSPLLCSERVLVCASEHSTVASSDSLQPTSTDHTFLSVMSCCCAATVTPHRVAFT